MFDHQSETRWKSWRYFLSALFIFVDFFRVTLCQFAKTSALSNISFSNVEPADMRINRLHVMESCYKIHHGAKLQKVHGHRHFWKRQQTHHSFQKRTTCDVVNATWEKCSYGLISWIWQGTIISGVELKIHKKPKTKQKTKTIDLHFIPAPLCSTPHIFIEPVWYWIFEADADIWE